MFSGDKEGKLWSEMGLNTSFVFGKGVGQTHLFCSSL